MVKKSINKKNTRSVTAKEKLGNPKSVKIAKKPVSQRKKVQDVVQTAEPEIFFTPKQSPGEQRFINIVKGNYAKKIPKESLEITMNGEESELVEELKLREMFRLRPVIKVVHLHLRNMNVTWMQRYCEKLQLGKRITHLAVHMLDVMMWKYVIQGDLIPLVMTTCIVLAVKFEDRKRKDVRAQSMINMVAKVQQYTVKHYLDMELEILEIMEWNLWVPTVPLYISVYEKYILEPSEQRKLTKKETKDLVLQCMKIVMDDIVLMVESPSLVAAAVIATVRHQLNLVVWNRRLKILTGYNANEVRYFFHRLLYRVHKCVHVIVKKN